ncbi:peptidylprolyl isomerase [Pullulanibacillus sp. KACC 23026]|uniref:peptidylprolyl isomerase n=1 Tax=Pullulanibacillus sp. KACC 23026 TaxID=3028315 RepID=UPI0023B194BA|nr:peptidylprolyl isomerase [Pullulanibacillus sp. KACC 23026]WEG12034.1 peptidylprolyl isomerase [Pullulanibacillus sp. KACC 23026]
MKKLVATTAVIFGIFSLTACGNPTIVKTKAGNITQQDFYKELKSEYGNQVIQNMVYTKLLQDKYTVTKKEINAKIKEVTDSLGGSDQLQAALQQQGMTMSQFKDNVKTQLLLLKAETKNVKVTNADLQKYFNANKSNYIEVKARHILVDKKSTADMIEKKLANGADFATLAKKYSTDTGSKDKGGELGWVKKGTMVQQFEDALFKLKKGQITTTPVKSDYGYHIIQAEDIKDSLSDFKSQVTEDYKASKAEDQQVVLNSLIKNGGIKVNDSQFKDLFKQQAVTSTDSSSTGTDTSTDSSSSSSSSSDSSSSSSSSK